MLLVEDDPRLCASVVDFFRLHAIEALSENDIDAVPFLLRRHRFDAVLLDLTLHGRDAVDLLVEVTRDLATPIIVMSARGDEADRVLALELGADDYLTTPFGLRELLARLRAVLRRVDRQKTTVDHRARFSSWEVDLAYRRVVNGAGHVVRLTAGEAELLRAFLRYPQRVLSRQDLLHHTEHGSGDAFDRSVDVLVARLRRKLQDSPERPLIFETVRRSGYRFLPHVTWLNQ